MRRTLTYGQLLTVERDLQSNLTLLLLMGHKVNMVLNSTVHQRGTVNARLNKIKEKYIQTDASGKFLTEIFNGQNEWKFREEAFDEIYFIGRENVRAAYLRESQKFLDDNRITIDI